ncbi:MAG TPA: Rossmann-like and DUF2520 domain-containing protein [Chitinophagaceae bacterium]
MNIVILGSGNVATVFGRLIKNAGHNILEVASRNAEHAKALADKLGAKALPGIELITKNADFYIVAVSDDSIANIASLLNLGNKIVVHTSGAASKAVLQKASDCYGVIYPLQSLRKEAEHTPEIPLLIDGNTPDVIKSIIIFAETISKRVSYIDDEERIKIHLSAVFVSNFTNHLYALAADYCKKERGDFSLLIPLIREVADRVANYDPRTVQTGPAVRYDTDTIQKHLKLLSSYPRLQKIYWMITESIQQFQR